MERIINIRTRFDNAAAKRGLTELEKQAQRAAANMEKMGRAIGQSMINVGRNLSTYVTLPIIAFGVASLKVSADFETGMNRVMAITSATGDEFEALKEQAEDLGATTMYSAKQAADAMGFLAMAGFEVTEIMGAMPATLQLAAAGQMDLAQAADISSNILTGYRMTTEDLVHANDVLVGTFTSTNTNLLQLGEAMKYVAPLAAGANMRFEEASAALGLLGNAGIQASMAGTTLRGTIAALIDPTTQEAAALKHLEVTTMDAAGNMLSLADIIEQFERSGATAAQVLEIFGMRAGPGMKSLIDQGSAALRELTQELIINQDVAQEIAEVQMEGLNGAMLLLKSATEGLLIAIGESGLLEAATELVTKIAAWVSGFKELSPFMQKAIIGFFALAAAMGPLIMITGQLVIAFYAYHATLALMGLSLGQFIKQVVLARLALIALNPIVLTLVGVITVATIAINAFMKAEMAQVEKMREVQEAADIEKEKLDTLGDSIIALRDDIDVLVEANDDTVESFTRVEEAVVAYIGEFPELLDQLGFVITIDEHLIDANGNVIDSIDAMQRAFNTFSAASLVQQLNQYIRKTQEALIARQEFDLRTRPSYQVPGAQDEGIFRSETGEVTLVDPEGTTDALRDLRDEMDRALDAQEEANRLMREGKLEEAIELLATFLDEPIIGPVGAVGLVVEPDGAEPGGAGGRARETETIMDRFNKAMRENAAQLEAANLLGEETAAIEERQIGIYQSTLVELILFRDGLAAVGEDTTEMDVAIQLMIDGFIQASDAAINFAGAASAAVDKLQGLIVGITGVEEGKPLPPGILFGQGAMGLQTIGGGLASAMNATAESFAGVGADIADAADEASDKVKEVGDSFLTELGSILGRFIENWGWKGGEFDVMGLAQSMAGPLSNMWAGDVMKSFGLGAGFMDPISGIISAGFGFVMNRIFGGETPLVIEQPVDMRLVDVAANLFNVFNWQGMDPFTYSSRYRGVFENGLY